jgi:hypothetical protein
MSIQKECTKCYLKRLIYIFYYCTCSSVIKTSLFYWSVLLWQKTLTHFIITSGRGKVNPFILYIKKMYSIKQYCRAGAARSRIIPVDPEPRHDAPPVPNLMFNMVVEYHKCHVSNLLLDTLNPTKSQ